MPGTLKRTAKRKNRTGADGESRGGIRRERTPMASEEESGLGRRNGRIEQPRPAAESRTGMKKEAAG